MNDDEQREVQKALDTIRRAIQHHESRDEMNAHLHLATDIRYSALTVALQRAYAGLELLLLRH